MKCTYLLRYQNGKMCSKINCKHKPSLSIPLNDIHRSLNTLPLKEIESYINTVYTQSYLESYLQQTYKNKQEAVQSVLDLHQRLYTLHRYESFIQRFQQRWRQKHYIHQNTEDPFTLEPISTIPSNELFQYVDANKHLHQFRIHELYHHCKSNGPYNPFTRETIPENVLEKLETRLLSLPQKSFENPWETPTQAFLDVLYLFEKEGFYTHLHWFMDLSVTHIFNIFILLHIFMTEQDLDLFNMYLLDPILEHTDKDKALIILANEMKALIQLDHPMKFLFQCQFFLILATVDPRIKRHLPQWIWNTV